MDWKQRQKLFHSTFTTDDKLYELEHFVDNAPQNISNNVINLLYNYPKVTIYPYKSYFVAVIYAYNLCHHFGSTVLSYLNDPELLFGNDRYFMPYDESIEIYDPILQHITQHGYNPVTEKRGLTPTVRRYFNKEFFIEA